VEPLLVDRVEYRIYAALVAVLALKMLATAFAVATARLVGSSWTSPEDTKLLGGTTSPDERVERLRRLHLNSLENEPLFMILGLLYVLAGAPEIGIQAYGYTFVIARIVHAISYAFAVQPFRTLGFVVGALALVGMSVQILLASFR
jgi:microsomal prostaglandin-E synthase 1